jgi:hypothetical protein
MRSVDAGTNPSYFTGAPGVRARCGLEAAIIRWRALCWSSLSALPDAIHAAASAPASRCRTQRCGQQAHAGDHAGHQHRGHLIPSALHSTASQTVSGQRPS